MADAPAIVLLLGLAVAALVVGPIFALIAFVRVRDLERTVADLTRRLAETRPPVSSGPALETSVAGAAAPLPSTAVRSVPAPPAPSPPAPPAEAPSVPRTAATARASFDWETAIAGQWLQRVGLLAITVGVAFFLKTAIDNDWIGPLGQVAIGILLGTAIIASASWFLGRGFVYFADGITGLGAAVLYLSLWAAGSYYHLVSPAAAFGAMVVVTAAMIAIALGRNSQRVAVLALVGGFLTPALVSTGQDAEVALFTYLAVQNAALLVLVHRRDWRFLEIPAFIFTQIYFWAWYDEFYLDPAFGRTTLFATMFFVLFAVLPVLRSRRHGAFRLEHGLVMLANVGLYLLALRTMMWPDQPWLLTAATLALAAFHLVVAQAVPAEAGAQSLPRLLIGGIALTLITIAIPMRLSDRWTSVAWAVEATVLMWTGFRVRMWALRAAGFIMFVIVGLRLALFPLPVEEVLWNSRFVVQLVAAASALVSLWLASRHAGDVLPGERGPFGVLSVGANVLILAALTRETQLWYYLRDAGLPGPETALAEGLTVSVLWIVYASVLMTAGVRLKSALLRWQGLALFGITTAKVFLADLSELRGIYRVLSAVALGVVLLIVSFLYQRRLAAAREGEGA
ncbi:MAG TPA: DUF2339 domain-containing protein [Vicinamibacterales bacterium]|nr:DUF2339 domain-containing protein [Vicinamibacterales bacterium]